MWRCTTRAVKWQTTDLHDELTTRRNYSVQAVYLTSWRLCSYRHTNGKIYDCWNFKLFAVMRAFKKKRGRIYESIRYRCYSFKIYALSMGFLMAPKERISRFMTEKKTEFTTDYYVCHNRKRWQKTATTLHNVVNFKSLLLHVSSQICTKEQY